MDLKGKPFYLKEKDIEWIHKTKENMTLEEKVGQLFCLIFMQGTDEEINRTFDILEPGGVMYRPFFVEEAISLTNAINKRAKIPLLIASNLEKGGSGIIHEGTTYGSQMEVAGTHKPIHAERLGQVCADEAKLVGGNWSFAPILDLDYNFRNPITNTRTFGSKPKLVSEMSVEYVKAVQSRGVAASIKHFPGDGVDERDQHLVTSVNDLSTKEWDETFGRVYKDSIEAGALTCMIGHIMLPHYSKKLRPNLKDDEILPASLSEELMNDLLRDKLGFNGLIVTDATTMAGFTIPMSRKKSVPLSIAAGADMFLFTRNLKEDYEYMLAGVKEGIISENRLDDAITRILALKAHLKLNKEDMYQKEEALNKLAEYNYSGLALECADDAITLVKEEKDVLPLKLEKHKRILLHPVGTGGGIGQQDTAKQSFDIIKSNLEKEGFIVDTFKPKNWFEGELDREDSVISKYDLMLYVANIATKSNQTQVRIEWDQPMGANCPHYLEEVPTIFISLENPYHLLDVPRIKTFINTYSSNDSVLEMLHEKLMGRSSFKGKNPVDPFVGRWDTRL